MSYSTEGVPECDGAHGCTEEITHIDEGGFIYCAEHGVRRQQGGWKRCRKLRSHELNRIRAGKPVEKY